jgi:hypothetical protein
VARRLHVFFPQRTEVAALGAHRWTAAGRLAAVVTSHAVRPPPNRDTTGVDREADFPFSKERWHRKVCLFVCDRLATYKEWKSGLVPPWVHRLPVLGASKGVN